MALRSLGLALSRLSLAAKIPNGSVALSALAPLQSSSAPSLCRLLPTASVTRGFSSGLQWTTQSSSSSSFASSSSSSSLASLPSFTLPQARMLSTSASLSASLQQMHRTGPVKKKRKNKNPLITKAFAKGVVLKTLIKKPRKPNSANRKCVLVRLSTGRELVAYVPGIGHNLQEHNIVLVRPGRLQDVPGVKVRCIRGKYDLQHVLKKKK